MNRRKLFAAGAVLFAGFGVVAWQRNPLTRWILSSVDRGNPSLSAAPIVGSDVCKLTPEATEGPFYVKSPDRIDIRDESKGLPLELELEIVRLPDCTTAADVTVEIWHCNAVGQYSGHPSLSPRKSFDAILAMFTKTDANGTIPTENGTRFLRGAQTTDATGRVRFQTIFPGWYDPRVPHIHIKVYDGERSYVTAQLYLPDDLAEQIYSSHPDYEPHGPCPYTANSDTVLMQGGDVNGVLLVPTEEAGTLRATARLGIA